MSGKVTGSCICGEVEFEIDDNFATFKLCHCDICKKSSGSAFVSNAFTSPNSIRWIAGTECVSTYNVPNSEVRKVFCKECGTTLPFITQNNRYLVVPVGSLSEQPTLLPQEIKSWNKRLSWYDHARALETTNDLHKKKS